MRKITLDLAQLTQDHIDRAMPNQGKCTYSSPCIIGALMTDEDREWLRKQPPFSEVWPDQCGIDMLVQQGFVEFIDPDQVKLAKSIQSAFDNENDELEDLLHKVNPGLSVVAV